MNKKGSIDSELRRTREENLFFHIFLIFAYYMYTILAPYNVFPSQGFGFRNTSQILNTTNI